MYNTKLSCQIGRPLGSIEELLHNFIFHVNEMEILQVFQNLLTCDEGCSKSPGRKNPVTFDNGYKQEVNGNVSSNEGSNGQDFRSLMGKKD